MIINKELDPYDARWDVAIALPVVEPKAVGRSGQHSLAGPQAHIVAAEVGSSMVAESRGHRSDYVDEKNTSTAIWCRAA
ncbi:hypothetical protein CLCR_05308 [Cladophialophora carrionii]|uniref:Uncharacterized protein n=1 Tax=Cladophialophora carrionii TaxID=86049 RepID=A0A1C1CJP8_9EURO|nr:hypothetical protein CLCR_05308 [Cladophialophora carrionii]